MSFDRLSMEGRLVVVTGAARGIGAATAELLVSRGAHVLAVDLHDAPALCAGLPIGSVTTLIADLADPRGWAQVVDRVAGVDLPLRALVNSAGVLGAVPIRRTTREHWNRTLGINLTGTWLGMRALAPMIAESGGGSIVNVSSAAGMDHHPDAAYTSSKWGVRGLTKTAAQEFGPSGVRVNTVHPGLVETQMSRTVPQAARRAMASLLPIARPGEAWEVAELIAYLASDAAAYVTGAEIAIDGGWTSGAQATAARRRRG